MPRSLQNSILQPSHTKAVIQASLKSSDGAKRVWCVVEADEDMEVFEKFFLSDIVSILPSTDEDGKRSYRNVESIVFDLYTEEENPKVFGIRDRDYTSFCDTHNISPNVFLTDGRDLEMMLLNSYSVIHGLQSWHQDFTVNVRRSTDTMRFLGYLRIFNDIRQTSCIFKDNLTKVSLVWNASTHSVYPDYRERLFSKFQDKCPVAVTREEFDDFVKQKELNDYSDYDVCRGHDVCRLLCVMMVKKEFSQQKDLFRCMKDSYSFADFKKTTLYSEVLNWADKRGLTIFI